MLKTARSALIDLLHHPPKWIEIQFKLNFPVMSLRMSPRMNSCRLQRGSSFVDFHYGCDIWKALYRALSFRRLNNKWPKQCVVAITLCRLQNLFISILISELFNNLRSIPLLLFSPFLPWWRWDPGPCIYLLSFATMLHPCLTAFLIKNVWSPINSPSTVPGPVGPTVIYKHEFAFLKPLS